LDPDSKEVAEPSSQNPKRRSPLRKNATPTHDFAVDKCPGNHSLKPANRKKGRLHSKKVATPGSLNLKRGSLKIKRSFEIKDKLVA
jgi:hypothetical protein